MTITLALRRPKQKDPELEASLSYIAKFRASLYHRTRPLNSGGGETNIPSRSWGAFLHS